MSIKINTKKLGLKRPVFIEQSVKNVKLANLMMNKFLKLNIEQEKINATDFNDLEEKEFTKKMLDLNEFESKFIDDALDFLQKILKLSNKERDIAEDNITMEKLSEYINYVIMRIKGVATDDINKANQAELKKDNDQKKDLDD